MRGEQDSRYSDGLFCVKLFNSDVVETLHTDKSTNTLATVKQEQKEQIDKVSVPCPQMICQYNNGMQGTDIMDQL